MPGTAELATQSGQSGGARPASQAAVLDALAIAQLSGGIRLVSADAETQLARFADPVLMQGGKINLISLEAVQKALADKWLPRKSQVFDFAERVLYRNLAGQGVYVRVSDTDFFVIHPQMSRFAAQAACLRYLREILAHFLGDDAEAVGGVLQVTRIGKGRLEAAQVDPLHAEAAVARGETGDPEAPDTLAPFDLEPGPKRASLGRWAPFIATDGRKLRISSTLEPIYELKGFTRIGFRMVRRVIVVPTGEELGHREIASLSSGDILRADLATILRGIDRLRVDVQEQQPSLIIPLSFSSLTGQRGRTELITPLKEAGTLVRLGVICEILDLDGVPAGALVAAASLVRPYSLLVVGNLEAPSPKSFARLAGAQLQALSFECPQNLGDAEFVGWAGATVAAARKVAKSVIVYRAPSPQRAGMLASFGASHVSLLPQ